MIVQQLAKKLMQNELLRNPSPWEKRRPFLDWEKLIGIENLQIIVDYPSKRIENKIGVDSIDGEIVHDQGERLSDEVKDGCCVVFFVIQLPFKRARELELCNNFKEFSQNPGIEQICICPQNLVNQIEVDEAVTGLPVGFGRILAEEYHQTIQSRNERGIPIESGLC
jgi:hypothetical protein